MSRPGVKRTARKKPKPKPAVAPGKAAPEAVAIVTRKAPAPAKGSAAPRKPAASAKAAALGKGGAIQRARPRNDAAVGRPRTASRTLSSRALRALGILLLVGAVLAIGLLVRQLSDAIADRGRPNVLTNDLVAAAASVAMLVLIAVVWRIARTRRD